MVVAFMPLNIELKGLAAVIDVKDSPVIQWEERTVNLAGAYNYRYQGKNDESYFVRNHWVGPKKFGPRRVT